MKKYFIGIIALGTAITLSSFTAQKQKEKLFTIDYYFLGTGGHEFDPSLYSTNSADLPSGTACDMDPQIACRVTVPNGYANINTWMAHLNSLTPTARATEYNKQIDSKRANVGQ